MENESRKSGKKEWIETKIKQWYYVFRKQYYFSHSQDDSHTRKTAPVKWCGFSVAGKGVEGWKKWEEKRR